jgi:hypothetical protein
MRRTPVPESTSIASIGYDPETRKLEVEFHGSGDIYQYFEVPDEEYAAILSASSKGTYFNQVFKSREYQYQLVRHGRRQSAD